MIKEADQTRNYVLYRVTVRQEPPEIKLESTIHITDYSLMQYAGCYGQLWVECRLVLSLAVELVVDTFL